MEDPSSHVLIDMILATFGNGETFTKTVRKVKKGLTQEPAVLLLPSDRQLWIFLMERDRALCDQD